jgi:hypothetical protein
MRIQSFYNIPIIHKNTTKDHNCYKNFLEKDIFVKSPNLISFGSGKFSSKFSELKKDLTEYITNSPEISKEKLQEIIRRYSPTTSVVFFENDESESELLGYTNLPLEVTCDEKQNINVKADSQTLFLATPQNLNKESRKAFLDIVLHECTHILQQESDDRVSSVEFYNSYLKSSKDIQASVDTIEFLDPAFSQIQEVVGYIILSAREENVMDFNESCEKMQEQNARELLLRIMQVIIEEVKRNEEAGHISDIEI